MIQTKKFLILVNVLKTDYNAKISEIENKISKFSGLATNSALTAVENRIPTVSNLVKKTDYDAKILNIRKLLIMIMINVLLLQSTKLIRLNKKINSN